jgi:hypothetical protein
MDFSNYQFKVPEKYSQAYKFRPLEDFVVAAYLAIRIKAATKPGRSDKDAARFAVALYHGMRGMVVGAQAAAGDEINWAPVEAELINQGEIDDVNYVNEVVQ